MAPQQLTRLLGVPSGDRVLDRGVDIAVLLVPRARASVKLWLAPRVEPAQLRAQHLPEQRVVAIRRASPIQPNKQDIRASERAQHPGGATLVEHCVAERARQRAEDRRAEEKGHMLWLKPRHQLVP